MKMFRVRLCLDDPRFEPPLTSSPKLRVTGKIRENMVIAKKLLYDGDTGDSAVVKQAHTVLDVVATMKRRSRSAAIPWNNLFRYSPAEELPEICQESRDLIADFQDKRTKTTSVDARTMPMALKLSSDGGCQLNDEKKTSVAHQLKETNGLVNIALP